jgi:ABC-type multidrug transport system fused ATPase/permease subunit
MDALRQEATNAHIWKMFMKELLFCLVILVLASSVVYREVASLVLFIIFSLFLLLYS